MNFSHEHFVANKDPSKKFDKNDYYENPFVYRGVFQD